MGMMRSFLAVVFAVCCQAASVCAAECDSIPTVNTEQPRKLSLIRRIIRGFDRTDERYIEPQRYEFAAMAQAIYSYDYFTIRSSGDVKQTVSFAPDANLKFGPYFGWRWIFGGYTFSIGHSSNSKNKTEIDLSIYSSQIGIDLFYRRTGSDYKLRNIDLGNGINTHSLNNRSFDGIKVGVTGFNVYYIFNHKHFSYPAAFAQSTIQKLSCGSWMAGLGFIKNTLDFDYDMLQSVLDEQLPLPLAKIDSSLMFRSAKYYDFNISGGYGYNWVFAKNWLFCSSFQMALAYKKDTGGTEIDGKHFSFSKINPDLVGRFALVYNNMRWYFGMSAIVRSNYYHKSRFSTNNTYGTMNMYVGCNFGLKKKYRQKE